MHEQTVPSRSRPSRFKTGNSQMHLQLLILLLLGEMLLVCFQKSCMKNRNPVPRGGESLPVRTKKEVRRLILNPLRLGCHPRKKASVNT